MDTLDVQADELGSVLTGRNLSALSDEVNQLFSHLNFIDVDESEQEELEKNLIALAQVRSLIDIALDLYPFDF